MLHARPRPLKKVLKDEAGMLFRFVRALAFFHFVSGMKAEPRYVARAMKAVTESPNQIEKLDVVVTKRRDFPSGYAIDGLIDGPGRHVRIVGIEIAGYKRGAKLRVQAFTR
jgi:hypothetical protein